MEDAIKEFEKYTDNYKNVSEQCVRKISHTLRVKDLCEEIAKKLNLSKEDIELAKMCGLLHDIGRFEQWKKYESFDDLKFKDHGQIGYEILTNNNFLRKFSKDEENDTVILKSVKYHNQYKVPDDLTDKEKLFTNIVRDADKIDIIYQYTIGKIVLKMDDSHMTDIIMNTLKNRKIINRKDKSTKADNLAVTIAFPYDINYKESLEILYNKQYLTQEIEIYKNKEISTELKSQLEELEKDVNNYMKERIEEKC